MAWFFGYIIFIGLVLGAGYLIVARTMGQPVAKRNIGYALPWMLVGLAIALIPTLVTLGGPTIWNSFYLTYVILTGLWLISWPLRKRKAGGLLLNAGRTWHNKCLFWIGLVEVVVAAIITWISWVSLTDFPNASNTVVHTSLKIAFWWMLAILIVSLGLNRLELRENGLCFLYNFIPWQRMKSYAWETNYPNTLTIRLQPRMVFLPGIMSIRVPEAQRDRIDQILKDCISFSPPDSLALS
ncbi:hypothetical protein N836_04830 [Leptolyngbya sp. Heron Island J]|uniref:hypothetical protein n=1 Tax=Leptolyngbya sp. Heron Island J TaxID=1385935 RepID=UPI0003B9F687|nr:hypothetical protein [Leptolyngbya sp. Heron Island J]ESA36887.1 hypothetical protein N836_04830 [Leptolyngbya sp. Heron Island J]